MIADLVIPGERAIIAQAGKGGLGNMHFVSSTRRAPRIATPGTAGDQRWVKLELRLVAEAGLVGLPNAGKSTLLAALSAARPKIAPYPFTTLTPNLGHVQISDEESFNIADIPGLIEGAHTGHGLGIKFLRHIKRTRVLVYVLDLSADPEGDFATVKREVEAFDPEMISTARADRAQQGRPDRARRVGTYRAPDAIAYGARGLRNFRRSRDRAGPVGRDDRNEASHRRPWIRRSQPNAPVKLQGGADRAAASIGGQGWQCGALGSERLAG